MVIYDSKNIKMLYKYQVLIFKEYFNWILKYEYLILCKLNQCNFKTLCKMCFIIYQIMIYLIN